MEARAHCRHTRHDFAHDFDFISQYESTRFPGLALQRDPIDSEDALRLSKQLWDRRWSRWWGYNWRRKRDLALRNQRYLDNRERFLRRTDSEDETERRSHKRVSFCGSEHFPPPKPPGLRRKLGRFLSTSRARIDQAGRNFAQHFKRKSPCKQPEAPRMDPTPTEWASYPRAWRRPSPPPADASLHSLEMLSRRLERLRMADRAAQSHPSHMHRGCGTEYSASRDIEKELHSSIPHSRSHSIAGDSPAPTAFIDKQQTSPVVVNTQRNDPIIGLRGDMKYDRAKLSMNQGLPFMYPHYPNIYTSPGSGVREPRLFSSVGTQTDHKLTTGEKNFDETNMTQFCSPRTKHSTTQTNVISRRDKETQWVNPSESSRTFSTQTTVLNSSIAQQMPSDSDLCLVESQKANDSDLVNLCGSFVRADSIRSVFGSNKTHVLIYRPELVEDEENSTVKLTAMEVFLPSAVSYDRYYAELSSQRIASSSNDPKTPRENSQLAESITPLIEITSTADQDGDSDEKKRKKRWFCHKH